MCYSGRATPAPSSILTVSAETLFPPVIQVEKGTTFCVDDYNESTKAATASYNFPHDTTVVTNAVTVKGTKYKKGMHVVLERDDEGIHMGEIMLILIHHSDVAYFIVGRQRAMELVGLGIHSLTDHDSNYMCVKQDDLLDYYPLMEYKLNCKSLIIFHNSLQE